VPEAAVASATSAGPADGLPDALAEAVVDDDPESAPGAAVGLVITDSSVDELPVLPVVPDAASDPGSDLFSSSLTQIPGDVSATTP